MVRGPILALGLLLQLLPSASGFLKGGPAFVTSAGLHSVFHPRRSARVCPAGPSLRMEAPRLGSVVMPPCKKLCPGCEPWICPLAPQEEGDAKTPHSESAARLLELMKEDAVRAELVLQKAQLEEIAAGVKEIVSKEEWEAVVAQSTQEDLVAVVFWGGSWCRKCQALKPKFVSLAANLGNEQAGKLRFYYADARSIAKSKERPPAAVLQELAGVLSVPTLQAWKAGALVGEVVAGLEIKTVMPATKTMILDVLK